MSQHPNEASFNSTGLSSAEAKRRQQEEGPNTLPTQEKHGLWAIIWDVMKEPMFLLLVVAGALYLLMGEPKDAAMLLGFVFVVMGITIVQERRTERALDALRDLSSPQALVIRDGQRLKIAACDLVRGDLIVLAEGDRIPADAVLREGINLSVDESLLTGESVPVFKTPSQTAQKMDLPGGDDLPSVFSGTLVTAGQGTAEVLATGLRSELGKIGKALSSVQPERTLLQVETGRLVRNLAILGLALCCMVVVVYALTRGGDLASWKQGFLAGIAMAMATLPEEFPVVLTIFLALGAWRISRSRVLTRRMPAIETLGATTVLCTDKTGTLTLNQMRVAKILIGEIQTDVEQVGTSQSAEVQGLLEIAVLASKPEPFDPMERAIHAAKGKLTSQQTAKTLVFEREYPLTPQMLAVTQVWKVDGDDNLLVASKGAPEAIADLCHLSQEQRDHLTRQVTTLAAEGLRILGVARGKVPKGHLPENNHDLELEFLGLLGLADPLRSNVPAAVAECQTAGIRVVMITGDYPATAQSIARQAGISNPESVITGPELEAMNDAELAERIKNVQVFARVVPEQKLRIVQALKANKEIVAMTGDGVNDAPALKAAHIGIAMGGRGTDVARESAALVLLDDDFASIVAAIKMGRRIFDNIKKAIAFIFAVHVPIAGLSIVPVFFSGWPLLLLPVHIVFLELVIDPSCSLIFEAEHSEKDIMTRPPRDSKERLFSWRSIALSLLQGLSVLAICLGIFITAKNDHSVDSARTLTFVALVAAFIAIIITNRSWSRSIIGILRTPNTAQWWVVGGTIVGLTLILSLPFTQGLFHFAPLHVIDLLICISAGLLCVAWFEVLKYFRRRHGRKIRSDHVVP